MALMLVALWNQTNQYTTWHETSGQAGKKSQGSVPCTRPCPHPVQRSRLQFLLLAVITPCRTCTSQRAPETAPVLRGPFIGCLQKVLRVLRVLSDITQRTM